MSSTVAVEQSGLEFDWQLICAAVELSLLCHAQFATISTFDVGCDNGHMHAGKYKFLFFS